MEKLPSNSKNVTSATKKKSGEDEGKPKLEKITKEEVIKRPKGIGGRVKSIFLGSELKTAGSYVMYDVLVPALRNLVVDTLTKGIERTVYGEGTPPRGHRPQTLSRYNYQSISRSYPTAMRDSRPPLGDRGRPDNDDIVLVSKEDAESVLERLQDVCDAYGGVTVADRNQLLGIRSDYTDERYGWRSMRNARIRPHRDGYMLDFPPAELLSN